MTRKPKALVISEAANPGVDECAACGLVELPGPVRSSRDGHRDAGTQHRPHTVQSRRRTRFTALDTETVARPLGKVTTAIR